jgi:hypothetical protein
MAKNKKKASHQTDSITANKKVSSSEQGLLGSLLSAALQEKKHLQKQSKKITQPPDIAKQKYVSKVDDAKLLQEFEKMASKSDERPSIVASQISDRPTKEVKTVREVVFVQQAKSIQVKSDRYVQPKIPPELLRHSAKRNQKRPNLRLSKVEESPVVLNLRKQEQTKPQKPIEKSKHNSFDGHRTQLYESSPALESDIIIGIDFGTSSTKVVVRDMGLNFAFAIPFTNYAPKENCYLLPTTIFINFDGTLRLDTGDLPESALKLKFIDNPQATVVRGSDTGTSLNAEELLIGYLTLALREIRGWFFEQTKDQYANTELQWHINVGIPSDNYDDKRLRERFESATQIAWYASVQRQDVDIELIKESIKEIREKNRQLELQGAGVLDEAHLHPSYFSTHPEVIMEVVGYVKSPLGEKGTHLLIDVGASTLDVATFRVGQREGEDIYPMLSCKVARLGSTMLHKKRIEVVKLKIEEAINRIYEIDSTRPLPPINKYQIGLYHNDIEELDTDFHSTCYKVIGEVLRNTMISRDPYSDAWQGKLPVFVCGGGSKEKVYEEVVRQMGSKLAGTIQNFQGFRVLNIPKPETLQAPNIAPDEYRRLAVAYGLSFSTDEIGEIIPESAVEDQPKNRSLIIDYSTKYIGPEQV